jgi:hypothetical protein
MNLENYIKFVLFCRAHPDVYDQLVGYLRKLKAKGFVHHSVKTCWDVLRFNIGLEQGPNDDYKLNDLYQSFYARLIFAREEDLRGFFEMRDKQTLGPHDISSAEVFRHMNEDFGTGYIQTEQTPIAFAEDSVATSPS